MTAPKTSFTTVVMRYLESGMRVLDLGAGDGRWSEKFAGVGANVIAVDRQPSEKLFPEIDWIVSDAQDYVDRLQPQDTFDLIFLRNIIQFLNSTKVLESLLPKLAGQLSSHGMIAIQTFYHDPIPPFPRPLASLYHVGNIQGAVKSLQTVWSQEEKTSGLDLAGQPRTFFMTEYIATTTGNKKT